MARAASRCGACASGPQGLEPNRPPSEGLQSFGMVRIEGTSGVMTVALHDGAGRVLHAVDVPPEA
jgi:alkaline phosphatase D